MTSTLKGKQKLPIFAAHNEINFRLRTRSLMDKIKDSGSLAQGSIPCGFTNEKAKPYWLFHCLSVIITSIAPTPNLAMLAMRFSVFL